MTKRKKYEYHKYHTFINCDNEKEYKFTTQLYKVGVYGILNNDPAVQVNITPRQMVKLEKSLKKKETEGEIKQLEFGTPITVIENDGLYEEV